MIKNLPAKQEMRVRALGGEDPPKEEMATHSSILAWEILWTEEPGGLWSKELQRVRHNSETKQQPPYSQNGHDKPPLLSENLARGDDPSRGKNISKEKESESVSRSVMSNSLQPHEQAPLFMGFSRQEYWRGLPFSSPG